MFFACYQEQSPGLSVVVTARQGDPYLDVGGGVGRGEDRRVVVDVRHVDVDCDGGGHGGGSAVKRLD